MVYKTYFQLVNVLSPQKDPQVGNLQIKKQTQVMSGDGVYLQIGTKIEDYE